MLLRVEELVVSRVMTRGKVASAIALTWMAATACGDTESESSASTSGGSAGAGAPNAGASGTTNVGAAGTTNADRCVEAEFAAENACAGYQWEPTGATGSAGAAPTRRSRSHSDPRCASATTWLGNIGAGAG